MCEVDVFDDLRFCDEFSSRWTFFGNFITLLKSLFDCIDFFDISRIFFKYHIYYAVVNNV